MYNIYIYYIVYFDVCLWRIIIIYIKNKLTAENVNYFCNAPSWLKCLTEL